MDMIVKQARYDVFSGAIYERPGFTFLFGIYDIQKASFFNQNSFAFLNDFPGTVNKCDIGYGKVC